MKSNNSLRVDAAATFNVPVEKLYSAWTNKEELKQWWQPMGNTLDDVNNEIKQGGRVEYIFQNNKLRISGEYLEVKEREKLVYTWNWELPNEKVSNADYMLTVSFSGNGDSSEISILQENFEDEESVQPHKDGWEKGLSALKDFLGGGSSSTNSNETVSDASGGYREDPEQVKVGGV